MCGARAHVWYVWKRTPRYKSSPVDLGTFRSVIYRHEMQIFPHHLLSLSTTKFLFHRRWNISGIYFVVVLLVHSWKTAMARLLVYAIFWRNALAFTSIRALYALHCMRAVILIIFTHTYLLLPFVLIKFLFNSNTFLYSAEVLSYYFRYYINLKFTINF